MLLRIDQLHTHYGLSHIVQGISLEADRGEIIGIFGRNGVGKTTLLKTIAGWLTPSSGEILLEGRPIGGLSPDRICRGGVGFVPEDRRIFPGLTVAENLSVSLLQVKGRGSREERRALDQIYARLPRLAERRLQLGTSLSGGEQQMLAIARAMLGEPKLVLIDEPTEGLAPMVVSEIFGMIRELRDRGAAILLVEQNVDQALTLADRFCVIERGRIILSGAAKAEADREKLMGALAV
jgi:branched-chain amino acid transport system ATP-binding protein